MLKFYEVDKEYINYLKVCEKKIPNISYDSHDKFVCGILFKINGIDYYAPISSFTKPQKTNVLIKNSRGKVISSIRLSFMFPVPANKVKVKDFSKEPITYRRLLMEEIKYCNRHIDEIVDKALYIYAAVTEKRNPLMQTNCCNFGKLEKYCQRFIQEEKSKARCGVKEDIPNVSRRPFAELRRAASAEADRRNGSNPQKPTHKTPER